MQAPTLNHDVYYEQAPRHRPPVHRRANPIETPYNSRLPSSTPHGSPPPMRRRMPEPQYYPPPNEANAYDPYTQHAYAVTAHTGKGKAEKFSNDRGYSLYSDDYALDQTDPYSQNKALHRPAVHPYMQEKSYPVMQARVPSGPNQPITDEDDAQPQQQQQQQKSIDISQLTREQLLHAALKVALEANTIDPTQTYRKSRPISPFKPGSDGFSATRPKRDKSLPLPRQQESQTSLATEVTTASAVTSDTDVALRHAASDGVRRLYFDPTLRYSVADLRIPERHAASTDAIVARGALTAKLSGRHTKSDGNVLQQHLRRVAMKNKKTQFSVASKKQKPAASMEKGGKNRKPVKSASKNKSVGSTASTHSIAVQADESGVLEGEHIMSSDAQVQTAHAVSQHKAVQVVAHLSSSKLSVISATSNAAVKRDDVSVPASASVSVTSGDGGARREAAAGDEEKEIDGRKIMKELDDRVKQIKQDLQTDLEHSMEPLREENTQLRRRVQSLTDQLQDKEKDAEKSDGEFTVAKLQMHNYNLEAEMKSQKALVSKLKDEVSIYHTELEKLLAEKARLLAMENGASSGGASAQLTSVNDKLKQNCDSMQEKLESTSRENSALAAKLQKLNFEHAQKDQEMNAMQHLVGSLQDSMKKLLSDLQKDQNLPASVAQSALFETFFKKMQPQRDDTSNPSKTPSRQSSATSFKRASHTPPSRDTSATHLQQARLNAEAGKKPADVDEQAQQMLASNTSPYAATEYNTYPGTSPLQTSAFEKLDPMIKDMLFARRAEQTPQQQQQQQQGGHFKSPSRTSITNVTSLPTIGESEAFDSTGPTVKELLTPLADRIRSMTSAGGDEASDEVMHARRALNFSSEAGAPPRVTSQPRQDAGENSDDSFSLAIKRDLDKLHYDESSSTLVSDIDSKSSYDLRSLDGDTKGQGRASSNERSRKPATTAEESRYSVTDYFKKYPDAMTSLVQQQQVPAQKQRWNDAVFTSPHEGVVSDGNMSSNASPQVELYRGTDLDTSLSTIDSSGTTTGSISSVDDRMFRQGLANLDANIERVQKSLRSGRM